MIISPCAAGGFGAFLLGTFRGLNAGDPAKAHSLKLLSHPAGLVNP